MRHAMRSVRGFALLFAGFTACGSAGGLAADTAGGVANWFATVAEAERLAEADVDKQQKPITDPPPAPVPVPSPGGNEPPRPAPVGVAPPAARIDDLRELIDKRNRLVNDRLFDAVKKLAAGGRANAQQMQALTEWFAVYFQMRAFVPTSRRDPNLGPVIDILEDGIRRRRDFVEGRILVVPCLLYAGRPQEDARKHIKEASKFLAQRGLNPTPFGLDCCGCWLRLGDPDAVKGFISDLKNPKIVPAHKLSAVQALLVAIHSWQTFRFNEAKDYFEKSLRRAEAFDKAPAPGVQGLLADAALFYLVAGNPATRDAKRGEMLLARIPDANQSWAVRRARAALHASKAPDAADPAAVWDAALQELEACRQESLPTLDTEIDEQLDKYRARELWYRERPKPPAKASSKETPTEADGGASLRPQADTVALGAAR